MPASKPISSVLVCGAGMLVGGLAGIAVGSLFSNELATMTSYAVGGIAGVSVSSRLFLKRN